MHSSKSKTKNPEYGTFRIRFSPRAAKSPVYIAGTFTNPPWQLLKMTSIESDTSDEPKFEIRLDLAKGQDYQYKFRLGTGEQWNLNEEEPIVKDEVGNFNNLLPTERNKYGWREKKIAPDQSSEILEERMLTKFTAEERQKVAESFLAKNDQSAIDDSIQTINPSSTYALGKNKNNNIEQQLIQQPKPHNTDDLRKYISDIKITDTGIMVPEVPRDPASTPNADMERFNGLAEIKFEDLKQNNKPSLSNGSKINKNRSSPESLKQDAKDKASPHNEGSESRIKRQQTSNLDIANTAAEVADMAALLDQEPYTPPVSDVEAGQTGLRRLSMTPIAEVARVAAEVADVAASLDDEQSTDKTPRQLLDEKAERLFGSAHTTPDEERVPRFSHEFPTFQDHLGPRKSQSDIIVPSLPKREEIPDDFDMNHPSIELFPTDRASIIAKLKEIQERLPEDKAVFESAIVPPVIQPEDWPTDKTEATSPNNFGNQLSKSLQPITEEEDSKSEDPQSQASNRIKMSSVIEDSTLESNDPVTIESNTSPSGKEIENCELEYLATDSETKQNDHQTDNREGQDITEPKSILNKLKKENYEQQDTTESKTSLKDTKISNDNDNKLPGHTNMTDKKGDERSTQLRYSSPGNDDTTKQNHEGESDFQDSSNSNNLAKLKNEPDSTPIKSHDDQVMSTGVSIGEAPPTNLRRPKSFQKAKSADHLIPNAVNNSQKDDQTRSYLNLILHFLFLDWIGNIFKWLWGTSKHDT